MFHPSALAIITLTRDIQPHDRPYWHSWRTGACCPSSLPTDRPGLAGFVVSNGEITSHATQREAMSFAAAHAPARVFARDASPVGPVVRLVADIRRCG